MQIVVQRVFGAEGTVTVDYAASPDRDAAPGDYPPATGTLTRLRRRPGAFSR